MSHGPGSMQRAILAALEDERSQPRPARWATAVATRQDGRYTWATAEDVAQAEPLCLWQVRTLRNAVLGVRRSSQWPSAAASFYRALRRLVVGGTVQAVTSTWCSVPSEHWWAPHSLCLLTPYGSAPRLIKAVARPCTLSVDKKEAQLCQHLQPGATDGAAGAPSWKLGAVASALKHVWRATPATSPDPATLQQSLKGAVGSDADVAALLDALKATGHYDRIRAEVQAEHGS